MLSAVDLDDQSFFQTNKIHDVASQRLLAAKLQTVYLPESEFPPKQLLSVVGFFRNCRARSRVWLRSPYPYLSPQGERNRIQRRFICIWSFYSFSSHVNHPVTRLCSQERGLSSATSSGLISLQPYPLPPRRPRGALPAKPRRSDGAGSPRAADWRYRRTLLRSDPAP